MELFTAITGILSLVRGLYALHRKVVQFKEDVDKFMNFIGQIERQLTRAGSILRRRQQGLRTFSTEVSDLLENLQKQLEASTNLLKNLSTFSCLMPNAPEEMKKLREEIQSIRLEMLFEMVFVNEHGMYQEEQLQQPTPAQYIYVQLQQAVPVQQVQQEAAYFHPTASSSQHGSYSPHLEPSTSPPRALSADSANPPIPSFDELPSASYYPPDHAGIDWQAYRNCIYPNELYIHPQHRNPPGDSFHPPYDFLCQYPSQLIFHSWRQYIMHLASLSSLLPDIHL